MNKKTKEKLTKLFNTRIKEAKEQEQCDYIEGRLDAFNFVVGILERNF